MTQAQFNSITVGAVVLSKAGKHYKVVRAENDDREKTGRYVYGIRSNADGTRDGLSNRQLANGTPICRESLSGFELVKAEA